MRQVETLGTTKVTQNHCISLLKEVREAFHDEGESIEIGDQIVYRREGNQIIIEPA